jgi:hypothetical protein
MLVKKILLVAVAFIPAMAMTQTTYLLPGEKEEVLLDRMEIRFNTKLRFSSIKPYSRRDAVYDVAKIDSNYNGYDAVYTRLKWNRITQVDQYNINSFLMANGEWNIPKFSYKSKRPILKHFYKTQANAFELLNKDFFLIANPVLQYQQFKETNNNDYLYLNSRGIDVRGNDRKKNFFQLLFYREPGENSVLCS